MGCVAREEKSLIYRLTEFLSPLIATLNQTGHPAALVGGIAVSVRTEPRFTRDIDLAVAVADDAAAEALVRHLGSLGWTANLLSEQESAGRLATVRLVRLDEGADGIVSDLLFASSGIEGEIVATAEELEILPGVHAPVACVGHLIALKLLARDDETRPQDLMDLRALMRIALPKDLLQASTAIDLITKRGFDRGRDLMAAFNAMTTK